MDLVQLESTIALTFYSAKSAARELRHWPEAHLEALYMSALYMMAYICTFSPC